MGSDFNTQRHTIFSDELPFHSIFCLAMREYILIRRQLQFQQYPRYCSCFMQFQSRDIDLLPSMPTLFAWTKIRKNIRDSIPKRCRFA